ncbi:CCHC-type domain-containing protein [Nephila pilipes]|uniref:CCHC-type domain-containing protein n=1 Tax=Nephila pilipes TaxID=299642 RepID=A0A8X6TV50_NEPPI|nr:CCHC-type domain-containing protein [Nephila pilipes]
MVFLIRSRKIDLIQLAYLDESHDPSISKKFLKDLIISSKYYKEEEAKELLEIITAERLETEQQEQLMIEKLRLEIELYRNVNQSAAQNNGQTSRVKSLDEIVRKRRDEMGNPMMGLREVNGTIVKREVFMVIGVNSRLERKSPIICFLGKILKKQKSLKLKRLTCFTFGSDKHFKRDCPKNKGVDNKRLNVNKVSTEGTELEYGTVAARIDLLLKVIPMQAIEDKLIKLVKTSISVDGQLIYALLDSGTEITVVEKDLVSGISVEGASTIYLKGIFGPAVKCPLVYVPISLATGGQVNVVHHQVICASAEVLVEDVLLPPDVGRSPE